VRRISSPTIDALISYHWPGNARELENCIERAVIMTEENVIHAYHLPPTIQTAESSRTQYSGTLEKVIEKVENEMIVEKLKEHKGNVSTTAIELGVTERILGLRLKKYGIDFKKYRK
jgi:Nif-specific regulatory protein